MAGYFLVLTGPRAPAASLLSGPRPLAVDEVFLFTGPALLRRLRERGEKIGGATRVRLQDWDQARFWPTGAATQPMVVSPKQQDLLRLFTSTPSG